MTMLPYDTLPFTSDREKVRFEDWLYSSPFSLRPGNLYIRPEQIDWPTVLELFREEHQRNREGWSCSPEDSYGTALRSMRGDAPLEKTSLEEQLDAAKELCHANTRLGISKIMLLAKQGVPEALFLAAEFHYKGLCVKQNDWLAAQYALKALEAGYEGVYGFLSMLYFSGTGVEKDEEKASHYRELASQSDHAYNQKHLGLMFMNGVGCEKDTLKGRECLLKAIRGCDMDAVVILGYYNMFQEVREDTAHDMALVFEAAKLGDPASMYLAGRLLIRSGAFHNSYEGIRDGMKYMIDAARAEWPDAISFLDADCELIKMGDGSTVERGEFYDVHSCGDNTSPWRWYRLASSSEDDKSEEGLESETAALV